MNPRRRLMFKRRDRDRRLAAIAAAQANPFGDVSDAPSAPEAIETPAPAIEEVPLQEAVVEEATAEEPAVEKVYARPRRKKKSRVKKVVDKT